MSTRTIMNGIAATLRHEGYRQTTSNMNERHRASVLLDESRQETTDEFNKRMALAAENEALTKKVADQEDLLAYWVSSSEAYRATLKFLRNNWTPLQAPTESPPTEQSKSDAINKKVDEESAKLRAMSRADLRASVAEDEAAVLRHFAESRKRRSP